MVKGSFVEKHRTTIEVIQIVVNLATMISIIFTVYTFYAQQIQAANLEMENKRILLESFDDEINVNLEKIAFYEENILKYNESTEWPFYRYSKSSLEQVISDAKIGDLDLRKGLRRIDSIIEQSNNDLDSLPIFLTSDQNQLNTYLRLKKERANTLLDYSLNLRNELNNIQPKIEELINSSS